MERERERSARKRAKADTRERNQQWQSYQIPKHDRLKKNDVLLGV